MIILISGSREGVSANQVITYLESIISKIDASATILHGGASGVDTAAGAFAASHNYKEVIIRPDYKNNPYQRAPLIRNTEMVAMADMVICIWGAGRYRKGGTLDTFKKAKASNRHIIEILPNGLRVCHTPQPSLF